MADIRRETQRADLRRKLRNARARLSRAEADVRDLEADLSWMGEQDDLDMIRSWRGVPDWSALLQTRDGMCLHMLRSFMLERLGFHSPMTWGDVGQAVLYFGVASKEDPAEGAAYVARIRRTIEQIAPFMLPHPSDGLLWFGISGDDTDNCGVELRIAPDLVSAVKISRLHSGVTMDEHTFSGLGEALFYIQDKHPSNDAFEARRDPADYGGYSGDCLRLALEAFFDGCRSAGIPVEGAGVEAPSVAALAAE